MTTLNRAWFLGALAASLFVGCDNGSSDKKEDPPPTEATQLFTDSDLSAADDANPWSTYNNAGGTGGSEVQADCAAVGLTGACLKISYTVYANSTGGNLWDSGLTYHSDPPARTTNADIPTSASKTYHITFKAVSDKAGTKAKITFEHPEPWAAIKDLEIDIPQGTTPASIDTGAFPGTGSTGQFNLQLGYAANNGATIYIDDIHLTEQ